MNSFLNDFSIRLLQPDDTDALSDYLMQLSPETKRRFAPHSFDSNTIRNMFFTSDSRFMSFVATNRNADEIFAYTVLRRGIPEHDLNRYFSFGIEPSDHSDCLIAPSVADAFQSKGLGSIMLTTVFSELRQSSISRVFLWGGVQSSNHKAITFYQKHGFITLGQFEHHGTNHDMYCLLTH